MKYLRKKYNYYCIVNENKMIGIFDGDEISLTTYGRGNMNGPHSLIDEATEISKKQYDEVFNNALRRLDEMTYGEEG
jgi:hypothetical protein